VVRVEQNVSILGESLRECLVVETGLFGRVIAVDE